MNWKIKIDIYIYIYIYIYMTQVQSLGRKDLLEKDMATHSSILPGKSHGQRSLVGYSLWGRKELDMAE